MRARGTAAAVLVLAVVVLSGCTDRPADRLNAELADRERALPSCANTDCADELAVLAAALAEVPGVVAVVEASYRSKQITDGAKVTGSLIVEPGTACPTLEDQVAELAWRSSVSPLMSVDLSCGTPGADPALEDAGYVNTPVRPSSTSQLDAWGDRGTLGP